MFSFLGESNGMSIARIFDGEGSIAHGQIDRIMITVRALIVILLLLIALYSGLLALKQADLVAAFFNGKISEISRIVYAVIGIGALFSAVFIALGNSAKVPGRMGRASGDNRGPGPGDGAVIHHSSGEADFDGLPGNALPPIKGAERDLPYPHDRNAD
jgi:uncharacterized membrane protein YuzA (DUF378 family)